MTTSDELNDFNRSLDFKGKLPKDFKILNPFKDSPSAQKASKEFNDKFYSDSNQRRMILGVCPGRFGAGFTGVPLTDTHRLKDVCKINWPDNDSYEPSSVFFYDVIDAYGGPEKFYQDFYVNAVCPLGLVTLSEKHNWVNASYYENAEIKTIMDPFIQDTMKQQVSFNIKKDLVICLGKSDNYDYLKSLNSQNKYFEKVEAIEHPRYIEEYKKMDKPKYIDKYLELLSK